MIGILPLAIKICKARKTLCYQFCYSYGSLCPVSIAQSKSEQAPNFSESRKQEEKHSHLTEITTNTRFWWTTAPKEIHAVFSFFKITSRTHDFIQSETKNKHFHFKHNQRRNSLLKTR